MIKAAVERDMALPGSQSGETLPPHDTRGRTPTHEEIAAKAYAIYLANGAQDGRDMADWLEAERRLNTAAPPSAEDVVADQYEAADLDERTPG